MSLTKKEISSDKQIKIEEEKSISQWEILFKVDQFLSPEKDNSREAGKKKFNWKGPTAATSESFYSALHRPVTHWTQQDYFFWTFVEIFETVGSVCGLSKGCWNIVSLMKTLQNEF